MHCTSLSWCVSKLERDQDKHGHRPNYFWHHPLLLIYFLVGRAGNFRKYRTSSVNTLLTAYDYGSVMHYGARYFSKNRKPTIVPKKSGVGVKFHEARGSSIKPWKTKTNKNRKQTSTQINIVFTPLLVNFKPFWRIRIVSRRKVVFSPRDQTIWHTSHDHLILP